MIDGDEAQTPQVLEVVVDVNQIGRYSGQMVHKSRIYFSVNSAIGKPQIGVGKNMILICTKLRIATGRRLYQHQGQNHTDRSHCDRELGRRMSCWQSISIQEYAPAL